MPRKKRKAKTRRADVPDLTPREEVLIWTVTNAETMTAETLENYLDFLVRRRADVDAAAEKAVGKREWARLLAAAAATKSGSATLVATSSEC